MKRGLFLLLLTLTPLLSPAQSLRHSIDSLRTELARAKADTTRARLMGELGSWYYSVDADSALLFGRQAVELARKTGDVKLVLLCRLFLANSVSEQNIPESMRMLFAVLQQAERINDRWIVQGCYHNMALLQLYLVHCKVSFLVFLSFRRRRNLTDCQHSSWPDFKIPPIVEMTENLLYTVLRKLSAVNSVF